MNLMTIQHWMDQCVQTDPFFFSSVLLCVVFILGFLLGSVFFHSKKTSLQLVACARMNEDSIGVKIENRGSFGLAMNAGTPIVLLDTKSKNTYKSDGLEEEEIILPGMSQTLFWSMPSELIRQIESQETLASLKLFSRMAKGDVFEIKLLREKRTKEVNETESAHPVTPQQEANLKKVAQMMNDLSHSNRS